MRAATYRKFLAAETTMMRASMPRTSAADPVVEPRRAAVVVIANRGSVKLVRPLTVKLADYVLVSGVVREEAVR